MPSLVTEKDEIIIQARSLYALVEAGYAIITHPVLNKYFSHSGEFEKLLSGIKASPSQEMRHFLGIDAIKAWHADAWKSLDIEKGQHLLQRQLKVAREIESRSQSKQGKKKLAENFTNTLKILVTLHIDVWMKRQFNDCIHALENELETHHIQAFYNAKFLIWKSQLDLVLSMQQKLGHNDDLEEYLQDLSDYKRLINFDDKMNALRKELNAFERPLLKQIDTMLKDDYAHQVTKALDKIGLHKNAYRGIIYNKERQLIKELESVRDEIEYDDYSITDVREKITSISEKQNALLQAVSNHVWGYIQGNMLKHLLLHFDESNSKPLLHPSIYEASTTQEAIDALKTQHADIITTLQTSVPELSPIINQDIKALSKYEQAVLLGNLSRFVGMYIWLHNSYANPNDIIADLSKPEDIEKDFVFFKKTVPAIETLPSRLRLIKKHISFRETMRVKTTPFDVHTLLLTTPSTALETQMDVPLPLEEVEVIKKSTKVSKKSIKGPKKRKSSPRQKPLQLLDITDYLENLSDWLSEQEPTVAHIIHFHHALSTEPGFDTHELKTKKVTLLASLQALQMAYKTLKTLWDKPIGDDPLKIRQRIQQIKNLMRFINKQQEGFNPLTDKKGYFKHCCSRAKSKLTDRYDEFHDLVRKLNAIYDTLPEEIDSTERNALPALASALKRSDELESIKSVVLASNASYQSTLATTKKSDESPTKVIEEHIAYLKRFYTEQFHFVRHETAVCQKFLALEIAQFSDRPQLIDELDKKRRLEKFNQFQSLRPSFQAFLDLAEVFQEDQAFNTALAIQILNQLRPYFPSIFNGPLDSKERALKRFEHLLELINTILQIDADDKNTITQFAESFFSNCASIERTQKHASKLKEQVNICMNDITDSLKENNRVYQNDCKKLSERKSALFNTITEFVRQHTIADIPNFTNTSDSVTNPKLLPYLSGLIHFIKHTQQTLSTLRAPDILDEADPSALSEPFFSRNTQTITSNHHIIQSLERTWHITINKRLQLLLSEDRRSTNSTNPVSLLLACKEVIEEAKHCLHQGDDKTTAEGEEAAVILITFESKLDHFIGEYLFSPENNPETKLKDNIQELMRNTTQRHTVPRPVKELNALIHKLIKDMSQCVTERLRPQPSFQPLQGPTRTQPLIMPTCKALYEHLNSTSITP